MMDHLWGCPFNVYCYKRVTGGVTYCNIGQSKGINSALKGINHALKGINSALNGPILPSIKRGGVLVIISRIVFV